MRKAEREIKDFKQVAEVVARCQVVRLGLFAEDYPYIVPLTFGYEAENGKLTVYFHCATQGKKIGLIAADDRVCLEWDILHGYVETGHSVTADYESVMAFGTISRCTGEERVRGLRLLLEHTGYTGYSAETCAALPVVDVYKVECERVTGKRRFPKTNG